jgi:hypothetical protein
MSQGNFLRHDFFTLALNFSKINKKQRIPSSIQLKSKSGIAEKESGVILFLHRKGFAISQHGSLGLNRFSADIETVGVTIRAR